MRNLHLFIAMSLGLAAASCSQDEPASSLTESANNQINFTVTADNGSRSASAYENGTDISQMYVSAWMVDDANKLPGYGSPNTNNAVYFINDFLTRSAGSGVFNYSSGARFWPANGEILDFFAVVDNNADGWNGNGTFQFKNSGGVPGLEWLSQLEVDKMPDLLYAYTPNQRRNSLNVGQQNVSFRFNHAFAKVIVTAEVKNENLRVCITDMAICGIVDKGRFDFPRKTGEGSNIINADPQWVKESDPKYIDIKCPLTPYGEGNPIILDMREGYSPKQYLLGGGDSKNDKFNDLLVIPHSYNGRNSSKQQTYIMLKGYAYNIANKTAGYDPDTDCLVYPKRNADGSFTPATIIIPIEFNWAMGTVNRYNIIFDCGNGGSTTTNPNDPAFVRIGYEVEVLDWKTGQTISPIEYVK